MAQEAFFEAGKRAIFKRTMNERNLGKVVLLQHRFEAMDAAKVGEYVLDPSTGMHWLKGEKCDRVWMVESLGDPIVYMFNGAYTTFMRGPVPEYYLSPLDDFEEDESLWIADSAPKQKEQEVTHEDYATEPTHGT
jgi:hypothetical protein